MKTVRIYKDDIRVNVLRSLLFTDTVLAVIGGLCIAAVLYVIFMYGLHLFQLGYYLSTLFVFELAFVALLTQKIDNQPISRLVPRAVTHSVSPKNQRAPKIDSYFTDFTIQDNMIVRPNALIRVFEIEPYDISLLNEQDREHFFVKLKQMIHVLPSQAQILVKKQQATIGDYSKHIFSLYSKSSGKTEALIENYIQDLTNLVKTNEFNTLSYFVIFSVSAETAKPKSTLAGISKLNDITLRFASAATSSNLTIRPLLNEEIISFMEQELR